MTVRSTEAAGAACKLCLEKCKQNFLSCKLSINYALLILLSRQLVLPDPVPSTAQPSSSPEIDRRPVTASEYGCKCLRHDCLLLKEKREIEVECFHIFEKSSVCVDVKMLNVPAFAEVIIISGERVMKIKVTN